MARATKKARTKVKLTYALVNAIRKARCDGCGRYPFEACPRINEVPCFREHHDKVPRKGVDPFVVEYVER